MDKPTEVQFDSAKWKAEQLKLSLTQEPIQRAITILKAEGYVASAILLYEEGRRLGCISTK
jgi:hypothetical protein